MRVRLFAGVLLSLFSTVVFAQWELLRGLATDIGVGARGDAMVVGIDRVEGGHSLYRWVGSDWQIVPGGAVRIDVDPQGHPWVVNSAGQILRAGPAGWQQLPGLARDIGIGANGSVWVVGVTPTAGGFTIHRWNGRDWDLVPGGAVRIDVDPRGTPWVVNDRGDILRQTPSGQWQRLPGSATAVTIATDGTAWMLGSDPCPAVTASSAGTGNDGGASTAVALPFLPARRRGWSTPIIKSFAERKTLIRVRESADAR